MEVEVPGPDFTTYLTNDEFEKGLHHVIKKDTYALPFSITDLDPQADPSVPVQARGLACRAYGPNIWSITLRSDKKNVRKPLKGYEDRVEKAIRHYAQEHSRANTRLKNYLGYWPPGYPLLPDVINTVENSSPPELGLEKETNVSSPPDTEAVKETFLNDIYPICNLLNEILLRDSNQPPSGLIAVTGATDASKSLITRGLIFIYLQAAAKAAFENGKRKPHLVTFEDPIEQFYIKDPLKNVAPDFDNLTKLLDGLYLDYTPREKRPPGSSLRDATQDALRQTPAVLFVGETRKEKDWRDLLEFAGSGNLVITTSHASSVVEAMSRIFTYTNTTTPAQRSEVSRRVLGLINIRSLGSETLLAGKTRGETRRDIDVVPSLRALLPALWKRTTRSMNNLTADGLASLIPELDHCNGKKQIGYYSRTYFAQELTKTELLTPILEPQRDLIEEKLVTKAREWDLEGA